MNQSPLVSVVLPVYNTSEFLDECINSLIKQTLTDIEMIFVDDGSTDDSIDIIRRYQQTDPRIQLYCQKNQYAGVARNNGMAHATGEYIIFLDSDDFFDPHMLEEMYKAAQKSQADVTICGYWLYNCQTKQVDGENKTSHVGILTPLDLGKNVLSSFNAAPWNYLYKRQFILDTGLQFQKIKNTNDTFFTRMSVVLAKTLCVLPDSFVYYRVNNINSLQGSFGPKTFCFGDALLAIKVELKSRGLWNPVMIESFYSEAGHIVCYYCEKLTSVNQQKQFFGYCKNLIEMIAPEYDERFFISPESIINCWLDDRNFEEYLFLMNQILNRRNQSLKKALFHANTIIRDIQKSRSYKLSRILSNIPRKIKKLFRKDR